MRGVQNSESWCRAWHWRPLAAAGRFAAVRAAAGPLAPAALAVDRFPMVGRTGRAAGRLATGRAPMAVGQRCREPR
eukprot:9504092-Pyramimonas_sp.AAC.3